jgi:hypothetical protein
VPAAFSAAKQIRVASLRAGLGGPEASARAVDRLQLAASIFQVCTPRVHINNFLDGQAA